MFGSFHGRLADSRDGEHGHGDHPSWRDVAPTDWDHWDMLEYLGLQGLQSDEAREKAPTLPRVVDIHAASQEGHESFLRANCEFPFLRRQPKIHQLAFVVEYFSKAYSADSQLNKTAAHCILADDPGLGKTTEIAMVIAYSLWAKQNGPTLAQSGVYQRTKPHVLRGAYEEAPEPLPAQKYKAALHPTQKHLKPILIVTECSVAEQLSVEISEILDPRKFQVTRSPQGRSAESGNFFYSALKNVARTHIVVLPWPSLTSEACLVDEREKETRHQFKTAFDINWSYLFFDEAHKARNPETATFKHAVTVAKQAECVFAVTATPVWNSPLDLLNMVRVTGVDLSETSLFPKSHQAPHCLSEDNEAYSDCSRDIQYLSGLHGGQTSIRQSLQRAIRRILHSEQILLSSTPDRWDLVGFPKKNQKNNELRRKYEILEQDVLTHVLRPISYIAQLVFIRRTANVMALGHPLLDIPPCTRTEVLVNLTPAQRESYTEVVINALKKMRRREIVMPHVLPACFEVESRKELIFSKDVLSAKVSRLTGLLKEILQEDEARSPEDQRKIVIYLFWTRDGVLQSVLEHLESEGIPAACVNGDMDSAYRSLVYSSFSMDESHPADNGRPSRILIISDCSTAGVNLQRANVLFLLDHPWAHSKKDQIIGRINRIGQTRPTQVFEIIATKTIDCGMIFAQKRKAQITNALDKHTGLLAPCFGLKEIQFPGVKRKFKLKKLKRKRSRKDGT